MPTYRYETKNSSGKVQAGILTAANLGAAAQQLRDRGEFILALGVTDTNAVKKGLTINISFGPGAKEVQNFTSQLSVMIRAGISIRAAIEGIADQCEHPKM